MNKINLFVVLQVILYLGVFSRPPQRQEIDYPDFDEYEDGLTFGELARPDRSRESKQPSVLIPSSVNDVFDSLSSPVVFGQDNEKKGKDAMQISYAEEDKENEVKPAYSIVGNVNEELMESFNNEDEEIGEDDNFLALENE